MINVIEKQIFHLPFLLILFALLILFIVQIPLIVNKKGVPIQMSDSYLPASVKSLFCILKPDTNSPNSLIKFVLDKRK